MNTTGLIIILFITGLLSLAILPEITYQLALKRLNKIHSDQKQANEEDNTENAAEKQVTRSEWELNEKIMTCIRLKVGDTYQCMLTENEKYEVGSRRMWRSTAPFIGSIDENTAVFKALRIGSTYIECSEVLVYYIEVKPKSSWFAEDIYDMICGKKDDSTNMYTEISNSVKTRLGRSLSCIDTELADTNEDGKKQKRALRTIMRIKNMDICKITQGLEERMAMILQNESTQIWIHKTGRAPFDVVDFAAFLISNDNEEIIFGLGQNWRLEGSEDELMANFNVFIHSFGKFLKEDELPQITASTTNKNTPSETQATDSLLSNDDNKQIQTTDEDQEEEKRKEEEDGHEQNVQPEEDVEAENELIIDEELLAEERTILEEYEY